MALGSVTKGSGYINIKCFYIKLIILQDMGVSKYFRYIDMMGIKLGFSHKWHFFAFLKWKCWSWVKYFALHLAMITSRLLYEPHWENIEMFCIDHLLLTSSAEPRGAWRDVSSNTTCSSPSSGKSHIEALSQPCACLICAETSGY